MIAITRREATCPDCGRVHGTTPWERSYWLLLIASVTVVDGGPVFRLSIPCGCRPRRAP